MLPPHDRRAGIIVRHIVKAVDKIYLQDDAKVVTHPAGPPSHPARPVS